MDTHYMTKECGLPEKQVFLTGDGHWWIKLDYRDNEISKLELCTSLQVGCLLITYSFSPAGYQHNALPSMQE